MQVRTLGEAEFRALGRTFRKAANGKAVRRELTKRLQAEVLKPAVRAVQDAVLAIDSKGVKGHGSRRREASHRINRPRSRRTGFGLRQSVARTIKGRVKYSGYTVGLRVHSEPNSMPNRQRKLPKYLNTTEGWRHPVWGNRENWVRQTGQPYFEKTLRRFTPAARRAILDAVNDALKELQR